MASVSVGTVADPWQGKLSSKEHRNWLTVSHAVYIASNGIRPFIEREMKKFHGSLTAKLNSLHSCCCTYARGRKPTPWHDIPKCPWASELRKCHNKNNPMWKQSDSTKWTDPNVGHWEIAKLFMCDLGSQAKDITDANTTDASGLLNLLDWCSNFKITRTAIKKMRDTRNKWGHAPQQKLSELERDEAFQAVRDLLEDPELANDPDAQNSLKEITALESQPDIVNFEEIEMKVLKDLMTFTRADIDHLENQIGVFAAQKTDELQKAIRGAIEYCEELVEEKERSREEDMEKIKQRLLLLESRTRYLETISHLRSIGQKALLTIMFIVFLPCWILQNIATKKSLVLRMAVFSLLQSRQVLKDSYMDHECGIEQPGDPLELKEFEFSDYLRTSTMYFTGRQWLFREMEELFKKSSLTGILIVGDPGSGKSAFVSHLICSKVSSSLIHSRILGYHFCTHSDKSKQNGAKFVRNMANMIASKIPEYRDIILSDGFLRRVLHTDCPQDPVGCFDQAIVTPLRQMEFSRPWYVVIDALDECWDEKDSGQEANLVSLLKFKMGRFPKWLKVILTSRNVTEITKNIRGVDILPLAADNCKNLEDIEDFIMQQLYTHPNLQPNLLAGLGVEDNEPFGKVARLLVNKSQGNFQYIKIVLDHWSTYDETISQSEIPKSLALTYQIYFQRKYASGKDFAPVRKIFEVLVAAYHPLTIEELYSVLQTAETDMDFDYDFRPKLRELSLFLWHGEANEHVGIYHLSLSEWLTSDDNKGGPYYVKKKNGHNLLARYYVEMARKGHVNQTSQDIFHLARHVVEGDNLERQAFLSLTSTLVNATDGDTKLTALHHSASFGNSEIASLLHNHFTEVDTADVYERTPIFIAATAGHYDIVFALFQRGANLHHKTKPLDEHLTVQARDLVTECKRRQCGYSLLHAASSEGHLKVVQFLVSKKVDVKEVTGANHTAFQLAAEKGHLDVLKELTKAGLKADLLSLHHAARNGHAAVVRYLLDEGVKDNCIKGMPYKSPAKQKPFHVGNHKTNISDDGHVRQRQTALHAAVSQSQIDVIKTLTREKDNAIECFDTAGRLPLHVAVYQDNHKALDILLASGTPRHVLERCKSNCSFLQPSRKSHLDSNCPCGYTPLHIASSLGQYNMAKRLIKLGADVNARDCSGSTPLHIVACHGISSFVSLLIREGAKINARTTNGSTPLHSAATCLSTRMFKLLLEAGSDAALMDQFGMTALHYTVNKAVITNETYFADLYVNNPIDWIESRLQEKNSGHVLRSNPWLQSFIELTEKLAMKGNTPQILFMKESDNATIFDILQKHGLITAYTVLTGSEQTSGISLMESATPITYAIDVFLASRLKEQVFTLCEPYEQTFIPKAITKIVCWSLRALNPSLNCNSLIKHVWENQVYTTNLLLQAGADVNCQEYGLSPLLVYLRGGGRHMAKILAKYDVVVDIKCGLPTEDSTFHLSAYHKLHYLHYLSEFYLNLDRWKKYLRSSNDSLFDYLLYEYKETQIDSKMVTVRVGDGPLVKAIKSHPRGFAIIDECLDANGYTALHRAAQGANLLAIKKFLSWGANPRLQSQGGLSPLLISVLYAIKFRPSLNFERPSVLTALEVEFASMSASAILSHLVQNGSVDIECDKADVTLLHLAATRGMSRFIEHLLVEKTVVGATANCSNKHGVTPMYLAVMLGGNTCIWGNPWCEVVHVLKSHGGVLQHPSMEAEFFLIFNTLFNIFPGGFKIDLTSDEIRTLRAECGRDECSDYTKSNAADYLNLSDELGNIFKAYEKAIGSSCQWESSPQEIEQLRRIEAAVPVLRNFSVKFNKLHFYFYNKRKKHIMLLSEANEQLRTHFQQITRPTTDRFPCMPCMPNPSYDDLNVCSFHGTKFVLDMDLTLKDAHNAYTYYQKALEELSMEATSYFYNEGKALGYTQEIIHALYKHETHLKCDWQRITTKYVRIRFLSHILKFWRNTVQTAAVTPIVFEFLSSRLEKILLDPSKESTNLILQLALGKKFQEYGYLERLKFLKPPLWKQTFPDAKFYFEF